jgi:polyhydroxyalkanoate synthase
MARVQDIGHNTDPKTSDRRSETGTLKPLNPPFRPPARTPSKGQIPQKQHDEIDSAFRAMLGEVTGGFALSTVSMAVMDWAMHIALSPGKVMKLWQDGMQSALRLTTVDDTRLAAGPTKPDSRFQSDAWNGFPYHVFRDVFMASEAWWLDSVTDVRGVAQKNEEMLRFVVRQMIDAVSPSNFMAFNPEILTRYVATEGSSLAQGTEHALADLAALSHGAQEARDENPVGKTLATTKGKVVARTHLMELIQYEPETATVRPEPVLIVPAWIMKYYILDLSPHNSFVRYLLSQGFTVFIVSWRNPSSADRDIAMDDYLDQGPIAALDAIEAITGTKKTHAIGYCLGGTLLTIAAAAMARNKQERLASLSLLAAQADFEEAGELRLFISDAQIALLEDMMMKQGYLDGSQMLGAFTMLRSNDLFWSRIIHEIFMGEEAKPNDLMQWNADTTRMPARMHADYLRALYLDNALSHGKYRVGGKPISLTDLRLPILAVGTESDHVAPWKSVYKIHHRTDAETTFILTNGGHNAGIVSEPGHPHRHYRMATRAHEAPFMAAEEWAATAPTFEGSWWPALTAWLSARSGESVKPPPIGREEAGFPALEEAPGTYVFMK